MTHRMLIIVGIALWNSGVGVCQPVATSPNTAPAPTVADEAKPSLVQLMEKFSEHEARYLPFHIQYTETLRMAEGVAEDVRKHYPWGDDRDHGRRFEVAQAGDSKWMKVEIGKIDRKVERIYKWVCTAEGIHHFCTPGTCKPFVAHGPSPMQFTNASPLLGVFPIRMTWPSNGPLLSQYFKEDPSRVKLSWDGSDAVLAFRFGPRETFQSRYLLWLSADDDWHPIRAERYMNTDQNFFSRWEATEFYHSTIGRQVRAGRIQYRHTPQYVRKPDEETVTKSSASPEMPSVKGSVGNIEQRWPIAYVVDFVVGNTTYGGQLAESLLSVSPPVIFDQDVATAEASGDVAYREDLKQWEAARKQIIGSWRKVSGRLADDWWGNRGVLDQDAAGERMDLVFTETMAAQYRSQVEWSFFNSSKDQPDPQITFLLDDKKTQIARYQVEDNRLILFYQGMENTHTDSKRHTAEFARVVNVRSDDPIPAGFRKFRIPNAIASQLEDDVAIGSLVDVLFEVPLSEHDALSGLLASEVAVTGISGPGSRMGMLDLTLLVPEAKYAEWQVASSFDPVLPFLSVIPHSAKSKLPLATVVESAKVLGFIETLGFACDIADENPQAALKMAESSLAQAPAWAKADLEGSLGSSLAYIRGMAVQTATADGVNSEPSATAPTNLVNELARIEIGLTTARKQYGSNHPYIGGLETRRDAIEKALAAFNGTPSSTNSSAGLKDENLTDSPEIQPPSPLKTLVDRKSVERQRASVEAVYREAEMDCAAAAESYRAEAAQETPDAKALAELKQKLDAAVKEAFEAQMQLQQVRLQLAELELAEVKAKHLRRESLAAKIIERRMTDLMNGEDLEWPSSKEATRSDVGAQQPGLKQVEGKRVDVEQPDGSSAIEY